MTNMAVLRGEGTGTLEVFLFGDIDMARIPEFHDLVEAYRATRAANIVVDLAGVDFMDSTGLGMMIRLLRIAVGRGGTITTTNAKELVARTIVVAGLASTLNLRSD